MSQADRVADHSREMREVLGSNPDRDYSCDTYKLVYTCTMHYGDLARLKAIFLCLVVVCRK